jgi:hypothetical protein
MAKIPKGVELSIVSKRPPLEHRIFMLKSRMESHKSRKKTSAQAATRSNV